MGGVNGSAVAGPCCPTRPLTALSQLASSQPTPVNFPIPSSPVLITPTSDILSRRRVARSTTMAWLGTICCAVNASSMRCSMSPSSRRSTFSTPLAAGRLRSQEAGSRVSARGVQVEL